MSGKGVTDLGEASATGRTSMAETGSGQRPGAPRDQLPTSGDAPPAPLPARRSSRHSFEEIDAVLNQAVADGIVPGIAAVATNSDGVLYEGYYGSRDDASGSPLDADTVFWFASMTKAVTATAAMQLVAENRLSLDEPIGNLIPELAEPMVLEGFSPDGRPQLRSAARPITLRQLLTHTSGFGYPFCNALVSQYIEAGHATSDPGDIASYRLPLLFDPGERWEYGIGIDWAGKAVELASGMRLEEYFRKHIFQPLGMMNTAFDWTPEMQPNVSSMHARLPDGSQTKIDFAWPQNASFQSGGGGLYGTAGDYARFLQMLLNDGEYNGAQILPADMVAIMKQNHIGEQQAGQLKTAQPHFSNDIDFWPGMQQRWGLSFLINTEQTPEGRGAGSISWAGLSNCYYWVDTRNGVCGVILAQLLPFADPDVLRLFRQFESAVYRGIRA